MVFDADDADAATVRFHNFIRLHWLIKKIIETCTMYLIIIKVKRMRECRVDFRYSVMENENGMR